MNPSNYSVLWAIVLLSLFSCEPPVVFTEPQPQGIESLADFPESFRGQYLCESDTSLLNVERRIVYQKTSYDVQLSRLELDTTAGYQIKGDSLFIEDYEEYATLEALDDSTYRATCVSLDTLFVIGEEGVLKKYRGYLVLNTKLDEQKWGAWVLKRDKDGKIRMFETTLPEQIAALEAITPVEDITEEGGRTQYRISPDRKAFRKLLKKGTDVFESCDTFVKVKREE